MATTSDMSEAYLAANKGPAIMGAILSMTCLTTIFVSARVFTRGKIMKMMALEDYLTVIALTSQWVCVGLSIEAVHYGNGRHFDTLTIPQMEGTIFYTILNFPFGIFAFGLPKVAVVALLIRIMNPTKWHRVFLWSLSLTCLAALLVCAPLLFLQCDPSYSQWDFSITDATCWDKFVLVYYAIGVGSFSAFTDLYLAIYPATVLFTLHLNLKKKIALTAALGIGSVAAVVAIYKCTRLPSLASADFSYDTADLVVWTVVEASTIIIASCIPVLQPLVDVFMGRRTLSGTSRGYKNYGSERSGPNGSRDIELEKGASSKHSRRDTESKNVMETGLDPVDSQESILRPSQGNYNHSHQSQEESGPYGSRIVRTDVVTVSYDAGSMDGKSADDKKKWFLKQ